MLLQIRFLECHCILHNVTKVLQVYTLYLIVRPNFLALWDWDCMHFATGNMHKEKTLDMLPKSPDLESTDTVSQPFSVDVPPASNKHSKLSSLTRPVVFNPMYKSADTHSIEDKAPPSIPPKSSQLLNKIKAENEAENVESAPIYSDVHKEKTPDVPPKSPDLEVYLSTHDTISQPFSVDAPPASNKHSKLSSLTRPVVCMKENPTYESADAHSSSLHNSPQSESNLYALPYTHKTFKYPNAYSPDNGIYSEAINPSDFTCGGGREMEKEEDVLQIYAPIYTDPTMLTEVFQQPVEVTSDNIQEVKELGTGQFGQVVLAATNGLSLKDFRLSNRNDDRDISVFVAVKKLKSNASKPQREAFDKEVKFMSRLKHPNVVYFLGVCYDDPAFIMMEHMEEGDLNQFLQRYSEIVPILTPSDNTQIATSTVVNMASQIASAMQYPRIAKFCSSRPR